jgi:hypothetical protein
MSSDGQIRWTPKKSAKTRKRSAIKILPSKIKPEEWEDFERSLERLGKRFGLTMVRVPAETPKEGGRGSRRQGGKKSASGRSRKGSSRTGITKRRTAKKAAKK